VRIDLQGGVRSWLRGQDVAWLLLFSALALVSPQPAAEEIAILAGLALVQVAAPRMMAIESAAARNMWLAVKLALGFLLIGVTGGILSSYYPILLLPAVSAATTLNARGAALVTVLAAAAYLSFVPIAAGFGYPLLPDTLREVALRVLFLPLVAFLTYQMAKESREQAQRAQRAVEDLASANRRLSEAEEAVRRTERLAALGQLTAGLAHELRNPLGTIRASAEMLGKSASAGDQIASELTSYISAEVDRANLLVSRFLDFARPLSLKKASSDMNAVVDRAVQAVVREDPRRGERIHKNLDPSIMLIRADPDLLERVLINLIVNALDASPPDATVTVKTRQAPGAVEITVLDRGQGVAAEHREQIFNPFFTTKPSGVGLGLAISAVQYLPIYGNLPYASRGSERGYAYAASWSMPVIETFDLLTPRFSGGLADYWSRNAFKLHSEYLGIIPLLFACVAVFRRWKERNTKFFTFSFLGALLMAWGGNTPFYYIPYYLLPGLSKFRGPAMIFFLAAFSLVALAGLGLDHLLRGLKEDEARKTTRTVLAGAAVPLVLLILLVALKGPMLSVLRSTTIPTPEKLAALEANYPNMVGGLLIATAVAALGLLLVRLLLDRKLKPVAFSAGLAVLMVLDIGISLSLWDEQRGYIRGVPPPKEYFAPDEATAFLKQDTSLYRVLPWQFERSDDGILFYNGVSSTGGQLPNPLQTYQDFIGSGTSVFFRPDRLLSPNFMNLANVKYVISVTLPTDVSNYDARTQQQIARIHSYFSQPQFELVLAGKQYSVYRNANFLPRMFVAGRYELAKNKDEVFSRLEMPDFNPGRTVLLYADPQIPGGTDSTAGTATITRFDCNKITAAVDMTAPGLLVLTENFLPEWRAYDNNRPVPVLQAYHTFRAVALQPGHHDIVFEYDPKYYTEGGVLTLAGLIFLLGTLVVALVWTRRVRPASERKE